MPRIRVDNVGTIGVVKDIPGYEIPANGWTSANNIRMQDGSVWKAKGYGPFFTAPPNVAPYWVYPVQTPSAYYWLYFGLNTVIAVQNQYHFDITRTGGYNASTYFPWNGGNLGGVPVFNNAVDVPQYWEFPVSHGNKLQDLPGWPSGDRCKVMKPFKNYLIALDVDRSGTGYPTMVKWSHGALIGAPPASWDITDPTLEAGENVLPQEGGDLVDQLVLRDINVLYRQESTWAMQFIGPPLIWRFWEIFDTSGILAQQCCEEFFGKHFVVTQDDVIVHDGQQPQSVADARVRRFLFSDISSSNYDKSFVVHKREDKEMWFCYPQSGSTYPDKVAVWSYATQAWSFRDVPGIAHAAYGVVDENASDTWDQAQGRWFTESTTWSTETRTWDTSGTAWSADSKPWNYRTFDGQLLDVVYADPDATQIWVGDSSNTENSATMSASISRTGIAMIGPDKTDLYSRKQIRAIYPHIEGTDGQVVKVRVGWQDRIDQTVTWSTYQDYTIGTTYKCDFNEDGRLMAVEFKSDSDMEWRLHGYQIDMEVSGDR
jgi:hypothetical protein